MNIRNEIKKKIAVAAGVNVNEIKLEHPELENYGDYSTNIALILKGGRAKAEEIAGAMKVDDLIKSVEVAGPGFVNISIRSGALISILDRVLKEGKEYGKMKNEDGMKIMVEFAHPNTHKELHIGHMRTLITGEALSRILAENGAEVFRANYQGDIGPHVAKAIWGTQKIVGERGLSFVEAEKLDAAGKAHLLGEGYVRGNIDYEQYKEEIDGLNKKLYEKSSEVWPVYEITRKWSLDYYEAFYSRFGTKYDKLFFESEIAESGKKLVEQNVGKVFDESDGAIIFDGEKYGLHKRVFVTSAGTPTYEGKEIALAYEQIKVFPFDKCIHVVANEQAGYFKVVIKALETLDSQFQDREKHLSMGMVQLVGRKMSSRTGEILRVDSLLDEIKDLVKPLIRTEEKTEAEVVDIAEKVTIGAVKWAILRVEPTQDVAFDPKTSVSLEGNSGPYMQYTYARTRSVLNKSEREEEAKSVGGYEPNIEEFAVLRWIYRFPEVIEEAANRYSPNLICNFLFELASRFNSFYNKHSILNAAKQEEKDFRLLLTAAVGQVLANGLNLLGIEAPEKM